MDTLVFIDLDQLYSYTLMGAVMACKLLRHTNGMPYVFALRGAGLISCPVKEQRGHVNCVHVFFISLFFAVIVHNMWWRSYSATELTASAILTMAVWHISSPRNHMGYSCTRRNSVPCSTPDCSQPNLYSRTTRWHWHVHSEPTPTDSASQPYVFPG
jgi:hypothetical protein